MVAVVQGGSVPSVRYNYPQLVSSCGVEFRCVQDSSGFQEGVRWACHHASDTQVCAYEVSYLIPAVVATAAVIIS
jgi:hypothetical protein